MINELRKITSPSERRKALADFIETLPRPAKGEKPENMSTVFCMTDWETNCSTPMCLAGWATFIWGDFEDAQNYRRGEDYGELNHRSFSAQAMEILDLTSRKIFFETNYDAGEVANYLRSY